jgi:hypothetical protein
MPPSSSPLAGASGGPLVELVFVLAMGANTRFVLTADANPEQSHF